MAWSLSSVGSWASGHSYSAHNFSVSAPSGSGGILLLKVFSRLTPGYSISSGWTAVGTPSLRLGLYARVSDGGANDSPTISFSGTTVACAQISRWNGGNTTLGSLLNTANGDVYFASEASPNGNIVLGSITPSVNNCLVLRMGLTRNDDGTWTAPPSGDALGSQVQVNLTDDMSAAWVYRVQTTAAAVGAGDITNGTASMEGYSLAVALTEGVTTTKYLKLLADSSAASATGVEVVVFSAPSDSNYVTGTTRYGSAASKSFEASLESGNAVLKVLASDVGCDGLAASATVAALARNTTYTTGMVSATIIEE